MVPARLDNLTTFPVVGARGHIRDCFVRPQTVAISVTSVIKIRRAEEAALVTVLTMVIKIILSNHGKKIVCGGSSTVS